MCGNPVALHFHLVHLAFTAYRTLSTPATSWEEPISTLSQPVVMTDKPFSVSLTIKLNSTDTHTHTQPRTAEIPETATNHLTSRTAPPRVGRAAYIERYTLPRLPKFSSVFSSAPTNQKFNFRKSRSVKCTCRKNASRVNTQPLPPGSSACHPRWAWFGCCDDTSGC